MDGKIWVFPISDRKQRGWERQERPPKQDLRYPRVQGRKVQERPCLAIVPWREQRELLGFEGWSQLMNRGRKRVGVEWSPRSRLIERCCGKGIEQIQKEGGKELVEHHLDCGYTGMCVLLGTLRVKEELEGGLGHVVWMMMREEEENSVNEVVRSIVMLGQCYEWGTSWRVHSEKILRT